MGYRRMSMWVCTALALAGCATPGRVVMPEPRPLGSGFETYHTSPVGPTGADGPEALPDQRTLSLKQARELALMRHPGLEASSHQIRAAEGRVLQAGLRPNPEIAIEVESLGRGGMGFDTAESAVAYVQPIELGGKRSRRVRVAEAEGALAGWDYESTRLDVLTETARRFVDVVAAQKRLEIATSAVVLASETSRAVRARVDAGKEPELQATRGITELETARVDALEAEDRLAAARTRLAAMWGTDRPHFDRAEGGFDVVPDSVPSLSRLRAKLATNPDLARWDAEVELREASLASEEASRAPDLEAAVAIHRFEEDGTEAISFGIGFPLRLHDRNQGGIAAAGHALAVARARRRAAEADLVSDLAEARARLASAHRRARSLRSRIVPALDGAFKAAHDGYKQGKFGFLDVLDAQRGLFAAKGELIAALTEYHIAASDLERLTGTGMKALVAREAEADE